MAVDKRTFIIVIVIIAVVVPVIVLAFHKSFFPIIISMKETLTSAALTNSGTGIPPAIMKLFSK
ncbi:MAG: hypothetical protein NT094_01605 [Candidatus Staskawiczbacteria bacterium]|nr:hypothetical protein [Candidatus Staskawiczbacteria bacterium]